MVGSGPERPTLFDVARRAGVSVSTASNALSGKRPVSADARGRVLAAAEDLAYEPDRAARSLVSRRSETIGIIVPDVTNPFFAELGRNLERRLAALGLAALIGDSDNDVERQHHYLTAFESRRVDGLIVVPAVFEDAGRLADVARRRPMVLIDRTVRDWQGSGVAVSQASGIHGLVDHLAQLGHRAFAFVSGARTTSTGQQRADSFTDYLGHLGLPPPIVVEAAFTLESGRAAVKGLFDRPTALTAICAADDLLGFAVLEGVRDAGLRVPTDVSLTGFDDIPYASFVHPALTTVSQPIGAMSTAAVDLLVAAIGGATAPEQVTLEPQLVIRASTAPPRSAIHVVRAG